MAESFVGEARLIDPFGFAAWTAHPKCIATKGRGEDSAAYPGVAFQHFTKALPKLYQTLPNFTGLKKVTPANRGFPGDGCGFGDVPFGSEPSKAQTLSAEVNKPGHGFLIFHSKLYRWEQRPYGGAFPIFPRTPS